MFSIVLVCVGNFQEYILTNIAQLIRLGNLCIYVITDPHLMDHFEPFADSLFLISTADLDDPLRFSEKTTLNREFRNGFWYHTSSRLFLVNAFMLKYGIEKVIHIENDVLLYYNCNQVLGPILGDSNQIHIPFDSWTRNIASILYIPSADVFSAVLASYDFAKNDMENFSAARHSTSLVANFPIYTNVDGKTGEYAFICDGWEKFEDTIFDAAAMGQYIGGVDPRNIPGDTRGFINETCVIKYPSEGNFLWIVEAGVNKPFFKTNTGKLLRIFNLHVHSKALELYCG
jgi:hypothetical protein